MQAYQKSTRKSNTHDRARVNERFRITIARKPLDAEQKILKTVYQI